MHMSLLKSPKESLVMASTDNPTPNNSTNKFMDDSDVDLLIDDRDRIGIEHGPILNRGIRGQTIYSDHSKYPSIPGSERKKVNSCSNIGDIPESNTVSPTLTFSLPRYLRKHSNVWFVFILLFLLDLFARYV